MKVGNFGVDPQNPGIRRLRLEHLLALWRQTPYWLPSDGVNYGTGATDFPTMTSEDWGVWAKIIRAAEPIPPRSALAGIREYASANGTSVDALCQQNAVLAIGSRAAARYSVLKNIVPELGGYRWSLRVDASVVGSTGSACVAVMQKRFRQLRVNGDRIIGSEASFPGYDVLGALLEESHSCQTLREVERLWRIAAAVDMSEPFIALLQPSKRQQLGHTLAAELTAAKAHLDVRTDAALHAFEEGYDSKSVRLSLPLTELPRSRFADLMRHERDLERLRGHIGDDYYETLGSVCAQALDPTSLGELLHALPLGRTLVATIDELLRVRPVVVASLVSDPRYQAEAAFALSRLANRRHSGSSFSLELDDEWLEVQTLARQQIIASGGLTDWPTVVAIAVQDELVAMPNRAQRHHGDPPRISDEARIAPWQAVLTDTAVAATVVDIIASYLSTTESVSEASIVFPLRLLRLLPPGEQVRLVHAIVDGYAAACALRHRSPRAFALTMHGPLLRELRNGLEHGTLEDRRRWLRPFDASEYVRLALAEQHAEQRDNTTASPQFVVPDIFRAHVETLAAEALYCDDVEEIIDAALELYFADRHSGLYVDAFSWRALAHYTWNLGRIISDEPLFVRLGRVIMRSSRKVPILRRIVRERPEAHILSYLYIALADDKEAADLLREHLRDLVNELLSDSNGIAVGHALELANTLQQAHFGVEAERMARKVIQIAGSVERNALHDQEQAALTLLAAALAEQQRWPEIIALDLNVTDPVRGAMIANIRAVAMIEVGRVDEARDILDDILKKTPDNAMALANYPALLVRANRWTEALDAAVRALKVVGPEYRDTILANEAIAHRELGHTTAADEAVQRMTPAGKRRFDDRVAVSKTKSADAPAMASTIEVAAAAILRPMSDETFDIVLSFAGEQRRVAEEISERLKAHGVRVFYDMDESAALWGEDLIVKLHDVYSKQGRFCVMLVSREYRDKLWTNHERRAAQERLFKQPGTPYILPIRIDDSDIPGLPSTIGHLSIRVGVERIVEIILQKLGTTAPPAATAAAAAAAVSAPSGWPSIEPPLDPPPGRFGVRSVSYGFRAVTAPPFDVGVNVLHNAASAALIPIDQNDFGRHARWPRCVAIGKPSRAKEQGGQRLVWQHRYELAQNVRGVEQIFVEAGVIGFQRQTLSNVEHTLVDLHLMAEDLVYFLWFTANLVGELNSKEATMIAGATISQYLAVNLDEGEVAHPQFRHLMQQSLPNFNSATLRQRLIQTSAPFGPAAQTKVGETIRATRKIMETVAAEFDVTDLFPGVGATGRPPFMTLENVEELAKWLIDRIPKQ